MAKSEPIDEIAICSYCGETLEESTELCFKRHMLAEHYDLVLKLCKGDNERLKRWLSNDRASFN